MKKFNKLLITTMTAGLMLTGCGNDKQEEKPVHTPEPYEEVVTWQTVEKQFQDLERKFDQYQETGYTLKEGEAKELINKVAKGYKLIKDGLYEKEIESVLDTYDACRKLELSGDAGYASLGESTKALIFSALGFSGEDGIIASYNLYANLVNYTDMLDEELEEPKGYDENLVTIDKNGTTVEPEMVNPSDYVSETEEPAETEVPEEVSEGEAPTEALVDEETPDSIQSPKIVAKNE